MKALAIILRVYRKLLSLEKDGVIPVELRHKEIIGTTQDDPFDNWIEVKAIEVLGPDFEVHNTGKLQTPDLIIRHKNSGEIVCIEVKKLTENKHGKDPRGWTIDYNSSLPCGTTIIKVGDDSEIVPLFYLFALLNPSNTAITTLILLDGDFLNYDFKLHKEAKTSNYMEYGHGPFGEGSVRHRKMYVYPNPLNDHINIRLPDYRGAMRLSIIDVEGRILKNVIWSNVTAGQLDLSTLHTGVYFLRVTGENTNESIRLLKVE